jgi:hypothetical protein
VTRSCGSDVGRCIAGTEVCSGGVFGSCVGEVTPVGETCNGVDDDCDGVTDEDLSRGCGSDVGVCVAGVQACVGGRFGACVGEVLPGTELCDGVLDEDCDGAVDEGCPCTAGQTQGCGSEFAIAPCSAGTQTCGTDGTWSACEGAIGPSAESCGTGDGDGVDNDCDGTVDEGCTCVPEPEVCSDGVDNDCDGTVDEAACTLSSGIDGGMDGGDPIPPGCGPTPASLCDLDACTTTLWTRPRELSGYAAELASRGSAAPIHGVRLLPEVDRAVLVFSDGAFDGTYHDADRWLIWDLASGNKLGAVDTGSVRLTEGPGSGEGEPVKQLCVSPPPQKQSSSICPSPSSSMPLPHSS